MQMPLFPWRKSLILCFLCVCSISACQYAATPPNDTASVSTETADTTQTFIAPQNNFQSYWAKSGLFCVELPDDWEIREYKKTTQNFYALAPEDTFANYRANFTIFHDTLVSSKNLAAFAQTHTAKIASYLNRYHFVTKKDSLFQQQAAYYLSYSFRDDQLGRYYNVFCETLIFKEKNSIFLLQSRGSSDAYPDSLFHAIFEKFSPVFIE
ncbi:MAG: PsbP-related protein [Chitinophagales bacterium]|nr:hypothetical protein [Bacteroidota bacterium]MCB9044354.1 hypothetical protein [Chitinophagales bacterium]